MNEMRPSQLESVGLLAMLQEVVDETRMNSIHHLEAYWQLGEALDAASQTSIAAGRKEAELVTLDSLPHAGDGSTEVWALQVGGRNFDSQIVRWFVAEDGKQEPIKHYIFVSDSGAGRVGWLEVQAYVPDNPNPEVKIRTMKLREVRAAKRKLGSVG